MLYLTIYVKIFVCLLYNTFYLLLQLPFFEDLGAMTLQYLDTLMQRDNLQKSQFFKGLPKVIAKLPKVNILLYNWSI